MRKMTLRIIGTVSSNEEAEEIESIAKVIVVGKRSNYLGSLAREKTLAETKIETIMETSNCSETKIEKFIERFCEILHL